MTQRTIYTLVFAVAVALNSGCAVARNSGQVTGAGDAAAVADGSAAPQGETAQCTTATGARWRWRLKRGTRYTVDRHGVTCAFARFWIKQLTAKRYVGSGDERTIPGGPSGWRCSSSFPVRFPRAWFGRCTKDRSVFAWRPRLPPSARGPGTS